ncbi:hypothetical protein SAICODRAFT_28302 [Saitoella complicata NRRL Y-17804]|uniref:Uncharacterized protein n=1 Tax=Saitoella complicata (strain BCRC 22490 / CBS 7301 / JCM 7358 / NBRC 10748 / NRRL Y-17804) TaxID=698492 RepID=A0A0E9NQ12_SAICN|nr:uncharacterized protein SAICODRAFT_28302 [Saitoella complicata NRRL Y-17804]ODQ55961.1 hypothetical protein SAICODRAFT_28302 [Saitoella complicata NRRL Y-17804]GAO51515.1 hypothetical protein G7K_5614-t1 [Saitoella complicata NRRL Y-17804]
MSSLGMLTLFRSRSQRSSLSSNVTRSTAALYHTRNESSTTIKLTKSKSKMGLKALTSLFKKKKTTSDDMSVHGMATIANPLYVRPSSRVSVDSYCSNQSLSLSPVHSPDSFLPPSYAYSNSSHSSRLSQSTRSIPTAQSVLRQQSELYAEQFSMVMHKIGVYVQRGVFEGCVIMDRDYAFPTGERWESRLIKDLTSLMQAKGFSNVRVWKSAKRFRDFRAVAWRISLPDVEVDEMDDQSVYTATGSVRWSMDSMRSVRRKTSRWGF